MTFSDDISADLSVFFDQDEHADAAVYNDGSADHDISVILDQTGVGGTGRNAVQAQAQVMMSQVPDPQYRQTIVINSVTWTIDQATDESGYPNDGLVWMLPLTRDQRVGSWT